jgi:O-methyltransferase
MIVLHDYNNRRFRGAAQAVEDYEKAHGPLALVPLCDLHGTAVIVGR